MSKADLERLDDQGMAAWNAHDANAFVKILAEDFVWNDATMPEPMRDLEQARQYFAAWMNAFPDMQAKVTNRVIGDDAFAAEIEFTGTNTGPMLMGGNEIPATGKTVIGRGTYFARVDKGKVVEFNTYPDVAGMMMQLGLMPPM